MGILNFILNFLQFFCVIAVLPLTFYILKQGEKKKSIALISLGNALLILFIWLGVMFIRSFIKSEIQVQEFMVRTFQVVNVLSIVIGIMFTLLIIFYAYKEICQIKKEKNP